MSEDAPTNRGATTCQALAHGQLTHGEAAPTIGLLDATLVIGLVRRLVNLNAFGFNCDEAVYAGQSRPWPVIRSSSLSFRSSGPTLVPANPHCHPCSVREHQTSEAAIVVAILGVATIFAVSLVAEELYGAKTGVLGALILALMPYHLVVTRQLLLDGPAVLCITLAFWMFARYVRTERLQWLAASAATLGLAVLTKETSIVLAEASSASCWSSPEVRRPGRAVALTVGVWRR